MRIILSVLLLSIISILGRTQTYVYPSPDVMFSDVLCNVINGHVLPETETRWSQAIVTCDDRGVYEGYSASSLDALYTFEEGKFYLGSSIFTSDIMYTYHQGVIYRGDSTYPLDRLYSFRDGLVYSDEGETFFDIVLAIEGPISVTELFWGVVGVGDALIRDDDFYALGIIHHSHSVHLHR